MYTDASNYLFEYLKNGTSIEMNVDASTTAATFSYAPATNVECSITRLNLYMVDANIRADGFGGLSALGTGLLLRIVRDGTDTVDFTAEAPITRTIQLVPMMGGQHRVTDVAGVGDDTFAIRWEFENYGKDLYLSGGHDVLQVVVRDDLTGLTEFRMAINGTTF
jgi:hypothetical protein